MDGSSVRPIPLEPQVNGRALETPLAALAAVKLSPLMALASGSPDMRVGLIDGPIAIHHPDLANVHIGEIPERLSGTCAQTSSVACQHGTFVAGILCAKRSSIAPAICPNCTLL